MAAGARLAERLEAAPDEKAVTVITLEEQMRGWLADISRQREPHRQVNGYAKLQRQVDVFADWTVLGWDDDSADLFVDLRRQRVRIGSMDLKIACIALAHDCTLLTRNSRDFGKVPQLRFQNWLD